MRTSGDEKIPRIAGQAIKRIIQYHDRIIYGLPEIGYQALVIYKVPDVSSLLTLYECPAIGNPLLFLFYGIPAHGNIDDRQYCCRNCVPVNGNFGFKHNGYYQDVD